MVFRILLNSANLDDPPPNPTRTRLPYAEPCLNGKTLETQKPITRAGF
jgi:hypothetical protein